MPMINRVPIITAAEWRRIARVLPANDGPGAPRKNDRAIVTALLLVRATRASTEEAARVCGLNPNSLTTRQRRWSQAGVLAEIERVGAPAILRLQHSWRRGSLTTQIERRVPFAVEVERARGAGWR